MTILDIARRWTILILAETLKISVGAVETILPFQPRWLAQIALLAAHLRAAADGVDDEAYIEDEPGTAGKMPSLDALLASHAQLRRALLDIGGRGLALDDGLLARMRKDWSLESVVSYLTSAEANLRDSANRALDAAAAPLGMTAAAMVTLSDGTPVTVPVPVAAAKRSGKPAPVRRREPVR